MNAVTMYARSEMHSHFMTLAKGDTKKYLNDDDRPSKDE